VHAPHSRQVNARGHHDWPDKGIILHREAFREWLRQNARRPPNRCDFFTRFLTGALQTFHRLRQQQRWAIRIDGWRTRVTRIRKASYPLDCRRLLGEVIQHRQSRIARPLDNASDTKRFDPLHQRTSLAFSVPDSFWLTIRHASGQRVILIGCSLTSPPANGGSAGTTRPGRKIAGEIL